MPDREPQMIFAMFQQSPIGVAFVGLDGTFLLVNPALCSMLGYAAHDLGNLTFQQLTFPADLDSDLALLRQLRARDIPFYQIRKRYLHRSGQVLWAQLHVSMILDEAGEPAFFLSQILDITREEQGSNDLKVILNHLPVMVGAWNREQVNRFGNQFYGQMFGLDAASLPGRRHRDVIGEQKYRAVQDAVQGALRGETCSVEFELVRPGGEKRYMHLTYVPQLQDGQVSGYVNIGVDLTERYRAEQRLFEQEELARVTLASIGGSVITTDAGGRVTFLTPVAERLTGWPLAEARGLPVEQVLDLRHEGDDRPAANPVRLALSERRTVEVSAGLVLLNRAGQRRSIQDSVSPILAGNGDLLGAVMVFHDVSESRAMALRMSHLAQHDSLTDLPNRVLLFDRIHQAITQVERHGGHFAMLFLDLDEFKGVNDTLGHAVGDQLLQEVARRLQRVLRDSDTISRQGGDEFIVLATKLAEVNDAETVASKVLQALGQPYALDDHLLSVTASVGIAVYPGDGRTTDELLKNAYAAMYQAKAAGRNTTRFYSAELQELLKRRREIQHEMRLALERGEYHLYYQPKVDAWTGRVIGCEALLRWIKPGGQVVPPLDFIPLSEETGFITLLGAWVLRRACFQIRAWQDTHPHLLPVSVNISAKQFADPGFLDTLQSCLEEAGVDARHLELELTESVLITRLEHCLELFSRLKEMGVAVSIDDFGTGFSSLNYLNILHLETIKIERSFLRRAMDSQRGASVLQSIIQLGQSLDIQMIAEGVESQQDVDKLLGWGCRLMQGYHFSRPLPPDALAEWLTDYGHHSD